MADYELEAKAIQPAIANTMSLGHNMPPISTCYEPKHKNAQDKTFWELLPDLQAPFAPEVHKFYEIGFNKQYQSKVDYLYVPVDEYEERLNDVVGYGYWIIETVGSWIDESGRPVLRMRLRVLDVVFESNGYAKPRGEWKGSLTEICAADGLKEAAERLTGMGKYLKKQEWAIKYVYENTTDETLKGEMRRLAGQRRLDLPGARAAAQRRSSGEVERTNLLDAMSDPPRQVGGIPAKKVTTKKQQQPKAEVTEAIASEESAPLQPLGRPELYPQHNAMVKMARTKAGLGNAWVVDYLDQNCNRLRPSQMTPVELNPLLKAMAVYALSDRFQNKATCESSYEAKIAVVVGDREETHFKAYCQWMNDTQSLPVVDANKHLILTQSTQES